MENQNKENEQQTVFGVEWKLKQLGSKEMKYSDENETITLLKANIHSQIVSLVEGLTLEKAIGDLKKGDKLTKTVLKSLSNTNLIIILVYPSSNALWKSEIVS